MVTSKRFLGIYLDENRLDYVHAVKRWGRLHLDLPAEGMAPHARGLPGGMKGLETFLRELSPRSDRRLFIGLPRGLFFVRDVELPPVPMEDALEAVRNALPVHVHLPVEEIYWDVDLVRRRDKSVNATLVYVEKKVVDGVLSVLVDTGHREQLEGLFPISFGIASWLRAGFSLPVGLLRDEDRVREVLAVDPEGIVRTRLLDSSEEGWARESLVGFFQTQWGIASENVYDWNESLAMQVRLPSRWSAGWPHPWENMGSAALFALLSRRRALCLDGRAPKIPGVHPAKVVLPLLLGLALAAWGLGEHVERRTASLELKLARLAEETKGLEAELKPLEKNAQELEQLKKLVKEADVFIRARPRFYELLNDMALRVPDGTWISQFNYSGGKMTASFQSPDSLRTLEKLRECALIQEVKLQGSVNRGRDGKETFTVVLELK